MVFFGHSHIGFFFERPAQKEETAGGGQTGKRGGFCGTKMNPLGKSKPDPGAKTPFFGGPEDPGKKERRGGGKKEEGTTHRETQGPESAKARKQKGQRRPKSGGGNPRSPRAWGTRGPKKPQRVGGRQQWGHPEENPRGREKGRREPEPAQEVGAHLRPGEDLGGDPKGPFSSEKKKPEGNEEEEGGEQGSQGGKQNQGPQDRASRGQREREGEAKRPTREAPSKEPEKQRGGQRGSGMGVLVGKAPGFLGGNSGGGGEGSRKRKKGKIIFY